MLFPARGPQAGPVTRLVIDTQPDRLPVVRWAGVAGPELDPADGLARAARPPARRADPRRAGARRLRAAGAARAPAGRPARRRPGRRRPGLEHPVRAGRTEESEDTLVVTARDAASRSLAAHRDRVASRWGARGPARPDERRGNAVPAGGARGVAPAAGRLPPRCSTSPAATRGSGRRSGTGSPTACGCASHVAARPVTTRPASWSRAPPASPSPPAS